MISRCFLAIFLLYSVTSIGQTYQFDFVLEYASESTDATGIVGKSSHYRFINSKDNGYMLVVVEIPGKVAMQMFLNNGVYYYATIPHDDFFVEAISIKCPTTLNSNHDTNSNLKNYKDYSFAAKADTIINTQPFKHFVLNPTNNKKIKKRTMYRILYNR